MPKVIENVREFVADRAWKRGFDCRNRIDLARQVWRPAIIG